MLCYVSLERYLLTFNNVAILTVPINASCRNAFRGSSWLHPEFCDAVWAIGVVTLGVSFAALRHMLS
jgi:hypothetical protein